MPPRATSKTAVSTVGFWSTIWADFGPAHVALLDEPPVDDDAVRRGHPDPPAHELEDVGDHPDRRRLAVRAGHGEDRDPRGRARREQRVHHRPGDVLRLAFGRMGVHPEPRRRVHLDDRPAGLADGRLDVRADEVDAGDVEADDARGGLGDLDVVGVRLQRPVDRRAAGRHVAGQGELDPDAAGRDGVEVEALRPQERLGRLVEGDPGEHLLVADAPSRIGVGGVHELADRVLPVAHDRRGDPFGDRREATADDEHAVVVAVDVRLDDDVARPALAQRARERGPDRLLGPEVEVHAPAVVSVERLDHAREAELLRGRDRLVFRAHHLGARDGQAGRVEEPVREALVGRDVDADGRRPRGHRRPDPLLVDALAELDERVPVEPDVRDVAAHRLVDEGLGGRPERAPLGQPDEPLQLRQQIELG